MLKRFVKHDWIRFKLPRWPFYYEVCVSCGVQNGTIEAKLSCEAQKVDENENRGSQSQPNK